MYFLVISGYISVSVDSQNVKIASNCSDSMVLCDLCYINCVAKLVRHINFYLFKLYIDIADR